MSAVSMLPADYSTLTADAKLGALWSNISANPYPLTSLPTAEPGALASAHLLLPPYDRVSFTQTSDEMPTGRTKLIHTYGSSVKVTLKIHDTSTYTGIFKSGGVGVARLSLAKLNSKDNYIPGMAVKILVNGQESQNFHIMFSLDGQGSNRNYFHNRFTNIVGESDKLALKVLEMAFARAADGLPGTDADKPESAGVLGLREQASVTSDGQVVENVKTPYVVIFTPNPAVGWDPASMEDLRVHLHAIPEETVLYTVSVKETMTAPEEVIGELVTTSGFVASAYEDEILFFQHAAKRWQVSEVEVDSQLLEREAAAHLEY